MERIMISYSEDSGIEVQVQKLHITLSNGRSIWILQKAGYTELERVVDVLQDAAEQLEVPSVYVVSPLSARAAYDSL